jgi:hypothetical protein
MALHAQITLDTGEVWLVPITLKVCYEWEAWSKKTLADWSEPTALDFAYLCWRAAINNGNIKKRTTLDKFASQVLGWEVLNIDINGIDQLEDWLKEQ